MIKKITTLMKITKKLKAKMESKKGRNTSLGEEWERQENGDPF